jgi:hypothetical protein
MFLQHRQGEHILHLPITEQFAVLHSLSEIPISIAQTAEEELLTAQVEVALIDPEVTLVASTAPVHLRRGVFQLLQEAPLAAVVPEVSEEINSLNQTDSSHHRRLSLPGGPWAQSPFTFPTIN